MRSKLEDVEVKKLFLDSDNPRFYHLRILKGIKKLPEKEMEYEIEQDVDFLALVDQIKTEGVRDPIWVVEHDDGKYLVIEGNRRTVSLRKLLTEKAIPPKGIRYDIVRANVLPSNTPEAEISLQRAILQAGKKTWGAFNYAANIFQLRTKHKMTEEEIANKLGKSVSHIRSEIQNYKYYEEFSRETKNSDPDKFSYFTAAPKAVQERFFKNDKDRKVYFSLISLDKKTGIARIRSSATRGGLRDFAKIIADEDILKKFLREPRMSVETAYEELMEKDPKYNMPFLKKIPTVSSGLKGLSAAEVKSIKQDQKIMMQLKSLYKSIEKIL